MRRRIVIVEDDPTYGGLIRDFHKEIDANLFGSAELIVIQTISMLKHLLATNGISVIVMDLTLTDSNQEETISMVQRDGSQMPPVFAITGDEKLSTRQRCLDVGFAGFALKKHVNDSPHFFFAELLNVHMRHG